MATRQRPGWPLNHSHRARSSELWPAPKPHSPWTSTPSTSGLINSSKEKYNIADEGKVVRIVMDYILVNPDIHDRVFKDVRCLRCE